MKVASRPACTVLGCALLLVGFVPVPDPELASAEKLLREHGIGTDGSSLQRYFALRTLTPANRSRLALRIRDLGDESFEVRQEASADLIRAGPPALPWLRTALNNADLERARRAERCIDAIEAESKEVVDGGGRSCAGREEAPRSRGRTARFPAGLPERVDHLDGTPSPGHPHSGGWQSPSHPGGGPDRQRTGLPCRRRLRVEPDCPQRIKPSAASAPGHQPPGSLRGRPRPGLCRGPGGRPRQMVDSFGQSGRSSSAATAPGASSRPAHERRLRQRLAELSASGSIGHRSAARLQIGIIQSKGRNGGPARIR